MTKSENKTTDAARPLQRAVRTHGTSTCDYCAEEWEDEFFCTICCGQPILEECEMPVIMWSGDPREPDTEITERYFYYAVCGNCCPGHIKKSSNAVAQRCAVDDDQTTNDRNGASVAAKG